MAAAKKLINLAVFETSGVEHPAHLYEGWIVTKSGDAPEMGEEAMGKTETSDVEASAQTEEAVEETVEASAVEEENAALKAQVEELRAEIESLRQENVPVAASADPQEEILKSAPEGVRKAFDDLRKQAEEATEALAKERRERAEAQAIEVAKDAYSNLNIDVEVLAPALLRIAEQEPALVKAIEGALAAANAQNESAELFAEVGKSSRQATQDAYGELVALAKSAVDNGKARTFEQAFTGAVTDNPHLYAQYLNEKGA